MDTSNNNDEYIISQALVEARKLNLTKAAHDALRLAVQYYVIDLLDEYQVMSQGLRSKGYRLIKRKTLLNGSNQMR